MVSSVEKSLKKNEVNQVDYQFLPLAMCPLPPKQQSMNEFLKIVGSMKLVITAKSEFGVPFGRDILVILFLIREALIQGNYVIKFKSIKHFLDTFRISRTPRSYKEAIERFRRIFSATWFWKDERTDADVEVSFRIIRAWNVYFSKDDDQRQLPGMDANTIELSKDFWEILQKFKIPYVLEDVIHLKDKPLTLALYLFLVYRTYVSWKSKREDDFIPYFGNEGLARQISLGTQHRGSVRREMEKCINEIREVWPDLPVEMSKKQDDPRQRRPNGLLIVVKSPDQLRVSPHWGKELGRAIKESKELNRGALRPGPIVNCPVCGSKMFRNPDQIDKNWPANYLRCKSCKKNYYAKEHAKEHPEWFPGYNTKAGGWNYAYTENEE